MPRPISLDFPVYFGRYISQVNADSLSEAVKKYADPLSLFYTNLPEEKAGYAYAAGKWTLKELVQHVIDTERIMSYRLLCTARKDKTPLPSFDEDTYAANSKANERTFDSIKQEFLAVRKATNLLMLSLDDDQLSEIGIANNLPVTANAVGYMLLGHMLHHKAIIEERYL